MSFFTKFNRSSSAASPAAGANVSKKDKDGPPEMTALEKHLRDATGPVRTDGSDKFFGFENYGNTCYANSIIQCLYYSVPFREHVMNFPPQEYLDSVTHTTEDGAPLPPRSTSQIAYPNVASPARKDYVPPAVPPGAPQKTEESKDSPEYKKRMALKAGPVLSMIHDRSNGYGMDESLFTALKDMFDAIKGDKSRYGVVSPHKFLEILRRENEMFRTAMHQDAHEFLNLLLNQVVDSVEDFSKSHPTLNNNGSLNGAVEKAVTSGGAAGHRSSTNGLDTHWVHDLFEGLLTSETRCLTCENTSQRDEPFLDLSVDLSAHTSVTSCLRKFSEEEMLCERNKFHCDNCGGLQEAEKRMKIKRLPRVLALHLKRFKYTEDLQRLQKLFHRVVYPFHLRLFNTTDDAEDPDRLYELYAVVVHIGGGAYHGHYVSIVKTQDRGWLLFDDEMVEPVDKRYVQSFFGGEYTLPVQDARDLACAYVLFYQETTLEDMLREQERETQQAAAAAAAAAGVARTSDVAPGAEPIPIPGAGTGNGGLYPTYTGATTITSPSLETNDPLVGQPTGTSFEPLAHYQTAPPLTPVSPLATTDGAANTSLDSAAAAAARTTTNIPATAQPKSKKELKQEEKARKAAAKAEVKALEEKRRLASTKRMENWRKQQEEMNAAIEASKVSAAEEAKARTGDAAAGAGAERDGEGAATGTTGTNAGSVRARFSRGTSMSLRAKPRWMGGGGGSTPTAGAGATVGASNVSNAAATSLSPVAPAANPPIPPPPVAELAENGSLIDNTQKRATVYSSVPEVDEESPHQPVQAPAAPAAAAGVSASAPPAAAATTTAPEVKPPLGRDSAGGGSMRNPLKHRFSLARKRSQAIS